MFEFKSNKGHAKIACHANFFKAMSNKSVIYIIIELIMYYERSIINYHEIKEECFYYYYNIFNTNSNGVQRNITKEKCNFVISYCTLDFMA